MSSDHEHQDLGFDTGFAVEIHAMHMESDDYSRTAERGEEIGEYSVLAKEYHADGCVTMHFDEEFADYDAAKEAAQPWCEKWGVEAEDIGG
jgi:hypothetical protein